jgi:hypothetical protein
MAEWTDTKRGLFGLAWFAAHGLLLTVVIVSLWLYFDGETLKAIYWLLLAVPISRLPNVFLIKNDPEGDAEYAAFLKTQEPLKK